MIRELPSLDCQNLASKTYQFLHFQTRKNFKCFESKKETYKDNDSDHYKLLDVKVVVKIQSNIGMVENGL